MKTIKELNALATDMVGDGGKPNLFFVTQDGQVVTVSRNFEVAHKEWQQLAMQRVESMLEDRQTGVVASAGMEPTYNEKSGDFDGVEQWQVHDDSVTFKFMNKDGSYK